jgi:hypothetical protein
VQFTASKLPRFKEEEPVSVKLVCCCAPGSVNKFCPQHGDPKKLAKLLKKSLALEAKAEWYKFIASKSPHSQIAATIHPWHSPKSKSHLTEYLWEIAICAGLETTTRRTRAIQQ